ncbi:O-antigen ligase family protein [Myxococcaceae bacterium GXIMD 01537]
MLAAALTRLRYPALIAGVLGATLVALVLGGDELWLVAAPLLLTAAIWAVLRLPVRYPALALLFVVLTVDYLPERPQEMLWPSPLFPLGQAFFQQLNALTGIEALRLPGVDLWLFLLLGVAIYRRATGSKVDLPVTPLPRPLVWASIVSVLTIGWMTVYGAVRGGDVRNGLWQWHQLAMLPLLTLLYHFALRGPEDWPAIRRVIVSAAFIKAVIGAYFIVFIARPNEYDVEFSTAHSDSMTFVFSVLVALTPLLERPSARMLARAAVIISIVGMGLYYNDRRLAYVSLGGCLLLIFLMQPTTRVKRRVAHALVLLSPLIIAYVAAGWNSTSGVFGPVQTLRSIIDGQHAEGELDYRDIENWDLIMTWRQRPLLGTGYGHVFEEPIKLPNIAAVFPTYGFHPHNSLLGMLAFGGVVGFTGLWLYLVVTVYLSARAYRHTANPTYREAALVIICMVLVYANQCFGDIGTLSWICAFQMAVMVSYAGKLAVAVGAWPSEDTMRVKQTEAEPPALTPAG